MRRTRARLSFLLQYDTNLKSLADRLYIGDNIVRKDIDKKYEKYIKNREFWGIFFQATILLSYIIIVSYLLEN